MRGILKIALARSNFTGVAPPLYSSYTLGKGEWV